MSRAVEAIAVARAEEQTAAEDMRGARCIGRGDRPCPDGAKINHVGRGRPRERCDACRDSVEAAAVAHVSPGAPRSRAPVTAASPPHVVPRGRARISQPRERLVSVLIRLRESDYSRIHALHNETKVPLSVYYREAVANLITKYESKET